MCSQIFQITQRDLLTDTVMYPHLCWFIDSNLHAVCNFIHREMQNTIWTQFNLVQYSIQYLSMSIFVFLSVQVRPCVRAVPSTHAIRLLTSGTCRAAWRSGRLWRRARWTAVRCWASRTQQSRSTSNISWKNWAFHPPAVLSVDQASQTETSGSAWHAWRARARRSPAVSLRVLTCTGGQMEASHSSGKKTESLLVVSCLKSSLYMICLRLPIEIGTLMNRPVEEKLAWWCIISPPLWPGLVGRTFTSGTMTGAIWSTISSASMNQVPCDLHIHC